MVASGAPPASTEHSVTRGGELRESVHIHKALELYTHGHGR